MIKKLIYLGPFLSEEITKARGISSRNAAGSNRMSRLAQAFRHAGCSTVILSPAVTLRSGTWQPKWHPTTIENKMGVKEVFCSSLSMKYLGVIVAPVLLANELIREFADTSRTQRMLLVYNYSPAFALLAGFAKYVLGATVVHNIEETSEPRLTDWLPKAKEVSAFPQIVRALSCRAISLIASKYILPTKVFLSHVPRRRTAMIITGCMNAASPNVELNLTSDGVLQVLFAGKISKDHGASILIDALHILNNDKTVENLNINVCGQGPEKVSLEAVARELKRINLKVHGFLSDANYAALLGQSELCLSLQSPLGRFAKTNTPSKTYEFMSSGKAVIATDVGDLAELPKDTIFICDPFTPDKLAELLAICAKNHKIVTEMGISARRYSEQNFSLEKIGERLRVDILQDPRSPIKSSNEVVSIDKSK